MDGWLTHHPGTYPINQPEPSLVEQKRGYALSCCSLPRSDIVCTIQDEDEVYIKQWGETFESGGVEWGGFLPEDD